MSVNATIGKIIFKLTEKVDQKVLSKIRNKFLKNKKFTIISNNCFGGWVYRIFNLEYQTPTIGLFIMPKDYLKFINNLEYYINNCELRFINYKKSKYYDYWIGKEKRFGKYPIGLLDDIEIHFLHYSSNEEAKMKWERRAQRIDWNNIIVKFSDQNGCTVEDLRKFEKMNKYKKKICFVADNKKVFSDFIYVKEFKKDGYMIDDTWFCKKYINLKNIIES